mmetsp:Transcript_23296/g.40340  ORF Transcript_23296/g.40340 Transcript_23296/m.40340 type:complete len:324 (+) Transcript_23296:2338-3309(+)
MIEGQITLLLRGWTVRQEGAGVAFGEPEGLDQRAIILPGQQQYPLARQMIAGTAPVVRPDPAHEITLLRHGFDHIAGDRRALHLAKEGCHAGISGLSCKNPVRDIGRNRAPEIGRVGVRAQEPQDIGKAGGRYAFLGVLVLTGGQVIGPRHDQTQIARGAHLVRSHQNAGVIHRLGRDHPVAAHGVLDVHVMTLQPRVQPPPRQVQKRAQLNLDPGADIGLFRLFQLIIGPAPGFGRHDHIVDTLAQHVGEIAGQRRWATCAGRDVGSHAVEQHKIGVPRNNDAVGDARLHPTARSTRLRSTLPIRADTACATGGGKALPTCR